MRARFPIVIAVYFLACGSLLADPPVKGAKEIFFEPAGGAVVSASRPSSLQASPAPASGAHGSSAAGARKGAAATPRVTGAPRVPGPAERPALAREASRQALPLGLSYWIELVGRDGGGQRVTDSRIFQSGEKIRLHFRSNSDGDIALLQLGSSGAASVLFPDPAKGASDSRIAAGEDRILPTASAWFRFDDAPGTERVLVLFARTRQELDPFSIRPGMDAAATRAALASAGEIRGGKDLILETETENAAEIGTYGVNLAGKPVVMEIQLKHR